MKRWLLIMLFLLCLAMPCCAEQPADTGIDIAPQLEALELSEMQSGAYNENLQAAAPEFDFDAVVESIAGGAAVFDPQTLLGKFLKLFGGEVYQNIHLLLTLIVLAIICAILTNLQSSFASKGVSEVAFLACYVLFLGILIKGFYQCTNLARSVIADQVVFLKAAVPPTSAC